MVFITESIVIIGILSFAFFVLIGICFLLFAIDDIIIHYKTDKANKRFIKRNKQYAEARFLLENRYSKHI